MKGDVPDAALTVLGHTDAIGTDAYNIALSRRRAESVMAALAARGVNPAQLSEVAIGKRQPIAPNDTAAGRALNRRVEFLISPALSANLAAVQQYVASESYFETRQPIGVRQRRPAQVAARLSSVANVYQFKPAAAPQQMTNPDDASLRPLGGLTLSPASKAPVVPAPLASDSAASHPLQQVSAAPTMPVAPVHLIPPAQVTAREIDPSQGVRY